ncbi:hypothetical protein BH10PSE11_BH10PSE11_38810 [soil metagenome]
MIRTGIVCLALAIAMDAHAQSVPSRVTGAVGGVTGAASGLGPAAGAANPFSALNTSSGGSLGPGGEANGGFDVRVGDKTVILKGAVGVEDGRSGAFRAGAGVPF